MQISLQSIQRKQNSRQNQDGRYKQPNEIQQTARSQVEWKTRFLLRFQGKGSYGRPGVNPNKDSKSLTIL